MKKDSFVKASIVVPPDIFERAKAAARRRGETFASLVRRMFSDHLPQYEHEGDEAGPTRRWSGVEPKDPLGEAVAAAARLHRLSPDGLVRLIVAENVAAYIERGLRQWEAMRSVAGPTNALPANEAERSEEDGTC
jgi:hypothetical protein